MPALPLRRQVHGLRVQIPPPRGFIDPPVAAPFRVQFFFDPSSGTPASSAGEVDDHSDAFVYRADDLVWPTRPAMGTAAGCDTSTGDEEDDVLRPLLGRERSRREFVIILGERDAEAAWEAAKRPAEESVLYPSCIRGHFLHARCFQGCLAAGSGCPVCSESLFVPGVQQDLPAGDDCCGRTAADAQEAQAQAAMRDVTAAVEQASSREAPVAIGGSGHELRMCPLCCAGPLLNEHCSDMDAHHGQCPKCSDRPFTKSQIADAVAKSAALTIGARIPQCPTCKVPVMFNGCQACGHIFTGTGFDRLPKWDPNAKTDLAVHERFLRTARILAAQVRNEASYLAHEQQALDELLAEAAGGDCGGVGGSGSKAMLLDFDEEPPIPAGAKSTYQERRRTISNRGKTSRRDRSSSS